MLRKYPVLLCAVALPLTTTAQTPIPLGKPEAEFSEPFSQVGSLRELRNGRVVVVDSRERTVQVIDFTNGTATSVGRQGQGPGEFGIPGRVLALPSDTSAIHDPANARYLLITPDGKPGALFRLDDAVATRLGTRGSVPRGTDARGRIFFEGSPFTGERSETMTAVDSTPLMRYDRLTSSVDTLTWVRLAEGTAKIRSASGGGVSVSVGLNAFPARDDWAPLADGGVAVVRVGDYHVERYGPSGGRVSGPPVRLEPIRVTEAERQAWRDVPRGAAQPRGGGSATQAPANIPWEFPDVMPPFVARETHARPNGELWVLRSHKSTDVPSYDVFDAAGRMIVRVSVPARARIVGFGNATVYVIRRDSDDLEYLQRYRAPAMR